MEELKANSIKKETHITHFEVKAQKFTSSMEKTQKEGVVAFKRSNEFKIPSRRQQDIKILLLDNLMQW